jgi:hypothetical protein
MADIFAAVDFSGIGTYVASAGAVAIAAALTWRGIALGRKGVNQVK